MFLSVHHSALSTRFLPSIGGGKTWLEFVYFQDWGIYTRSWFLDECCTNLGLFNARSSSDNSVFIHRQGFSKEVKRLNWSISSLFHMPVFRLLVKFLSSLFRFRSGVVWRISNTISCSLCNSNSYFRTKHFIKQSQITARKLWELKWIFLIWWYRLEWGAVLSPALLSGSFM